MSYRPGGGWVTSLTIGVQMGMRAKDPDPGDVRCDFLWRYLAVANATACAGFLAGHPYGTWIHEVDRKSKPCKLRMSDGALACPLCSVLPVKYRGYLPLYDAQYVRRFVLISRDHVESVREIPVHALIKISRAKAAKAPVVIAADQWRIAPLPTDAARGREVDLTSFLLRIWGDQELSAWHATSDSPLSHAAEAGPPGLMAGYPDESEVGPEYRTEWLRAAAESRARSTADRMIGDDVDKALSPSRNGKHKSQKPR